MSDTPTGGRADHWDTAYNDRGTQGVSWYQPEPGVSLALVEVLGVSSERSVIDVGGGASLLVDRLVERGWSDVTVLDISAAALESAAGRLDPATPVTWLCEDLLAWRPTRRYGLWHDRAVFHFLVDAADRDTYLHVLRAAVESAGSLILGTFAPDGPEYCSGLPVIRFSPDDLAALLTDRGFEVVDSRREGHTTPAGVVQPFTWVAATSIR